MNSDPAIPFLNAVVRNQETQRNSAEIADVSSSDGVDRHADVQSGEDVSWCLLQYRDSPTARSDEDLLLALQQGDGEALAILFRRYASMVRAVARRILHNASEADDVLQEVFLFVFRKGALFDPARGSVRSWLGQVTWHRAIDRRRYLESRHFYTNIELEDQLFGPKDSRSPLNLYDESIEGLFGQETLRKIAESLSEDQHRVVYLYFFEGYTIEEIAEVLGQTEGNVRNHYYRALQKIRLQVFPAKLRKK